MKYVYPHDTGFYATLKARVADHFERRGIDRFADHLLLTKAIVHVALAIALYIAILSGWFHGLVLALLVAAFGFNQMMIALNLAHDASHHAFSDRPWLNRAFTYAFDAVGVDSYIWNFNHIRSHHSLPNVPLKDSAIDSFAVLSLHPRATGLPIRRFQHLYIVGIYAISTLFKFFFLDYFTYGRREIGGVRAPERHPWRAKALLVVSKLVVATYMLVIPLVVLDSPGAVIAGYVLGHVLAGLLIAVVFQVTHLADGTAFPEPDASGRMPYPFAEHILRTTADLAPRSRIVQWIGGGLNLHVAHHLFPNIAHTHLPEVTEIVKATAREFGLPYRSNETIRAALASHVRLLAQLGRGDVAPVTRAAAV